MTGDELRQLLRSSAFRPFTVYTDGKEFFIPHPEFAALSGPWTGSGQTLVIFHKEDNGFDLLDVGLVSRVEVQRTSP